MATPVPKEVSLETLEKIIHAWYLSDAGETPQTNKSVSSRSDIAKSTISRQNKFLTELEVLEKEGQKKKLSEAGVEFARARDLGKEHAAHNLADLLYDYDPTDKLIDYIKLEEPSADALLQKLAELTDQDPDSNVEFDTLIDLYCAAGILEEREDGSYIARRKKELEGAEDVDSGQGQTHTESENDPETTQEVDQQPNKRDQILEDGSSVISQKAAEYSVNIDLQVDADDDPIEVAKLVVAISKALEDDLDADLKVESDDGEQGQAQLTLDNIDAT